MDEQQQATENLHAALRAYWETVVVPQWKGRYEDWTFGVGTLQTMQDATAAMIDEIARDYVGTWSDKD